MKIAFVTSYFGKEIDGAAQVIKELSSRLIKDGHEVHVYAPAWDKKKRIPSGDEIIDGINVHRCFYWFKVANFSTFWPSVFFKLMKQDFDVIHTHITGHPHVFFASLAAQFKKTKLIHTTHAPWTKGHRSFMGNLYAPISYNIFMRLCYKWSNKIIAISSWEIPYIERYGGKGKIVVITNGVNDIFFKKIKNNTFKKNYKINGKIVLFFGRLDPIKGPDKFVMAANETLKTKKDINFVLVGPDEGMKQELIKLANNSSKIIFIDAIRDRNKVAEMYQAAEICVLPSYREGSPLTLFEAMASGLPIAASNADGIKAVLKEGENGLMCDFEDYKKLSINILRLIEDKKLAAKISKNNLKDVKNYTWSQIYKKTIELYN